MRKEGAKEIISCRSHELWSRSRLNKLLHLLLGAQYRLQVVNGVGCGMILRERLERSIFRRVSKRLIII